MGEKLIEQLPQIIWAAAAFMAALTAFRGHATKAQLNSIEKKVDGGMTNLMNALAEIAKQAQAASAGKTVVIKEGQRATDGARE